jgi:ADP-heptose:LPS heptosyltransferase
VKNVIVFIRSMQFLGTQIVSYPLLYQIKQFWPACHLRVVAQDAVSQHYLTLPWVDAFTQADKLPEVYRAMNGDADLVIALHFASEKYGIAALLKRPKFRLGFKNKRVTDFVWTHSHRKDFSEYMGLANLRVLAALKDFDPAQAARQCVQALAAIDGQTSIGGSSELAHANDASDSRSRLSEPSAHPPSAGDANAPQIVLMPGGGAGDYKRWPIEHYVALADLLKSTLMPQASFCFVMGPDEAEQHRWLQSLGRSDFVYLMTRPLSEIAKAVMGAKLVVANDCGPSHLAQFAGVPYVGVFHESNREWFWARETSADVLPQDGTCEIKNVTPEQVLGACQQVLSLAVSNDPHSLSEG